MAVRRGAGRPGGRWSSGPTLVVHGDKPREPVCLVVGDRAAFEVQRTRESLAKRKTFLAELLAKGVQK